MRAARQPVHVVYGGAHLFRAGTAAKLGRLALAAIDQFGPLPAALGISESTSARVREKLQHEPVEDYRIDFEDGYGYRSDAEEDAHAVAAARELKAGLAAGSLPPFIGLRIKPLTAELRARAVRTLDLFLREAAGSVPANFIVTLPKLTSPAEPAELAHRLDLLERELGLPAGFIGFEIMIETPEALQSANLLEFLQAGEGRIRGAHFGAYDYTSSIGISSAVQDLMHPACDMARHAMQIAYAPAGIWLSDGATNTMPVGDAAAVHAGWQMHYRHVRHSLRMGFYQGWDLHPAQIVSRYAAVYSFYEEALESAAERLRNFVNRAAQASLVGQQFDDAATGQGLLNFFLRAINCGAISEQEALRSTGLTHGEVAAGSFLRIVEQRQS